MEPHPHEKVLEKIAELMQFIYDNAHKPLPDEKIELVEAQLNDLENQVRAFEKESEKIIEGSGLTDYLFETMKRDEKSGILSDTELKLLQRAEFLLNEARKASQDVERASKNAKAEGRKLVGKERDEKSRSRKGKFRSFGGVKNWKPL
jgi:vacuolar-type H+-ATPase subunit I/STV1